EGGKLLPSAARGEIVDGDGLAVHIAQVAQALEELVKSARLRRTWIERKEAQPRDPPRWLRRSGEGQREHYEGKEKGGDTHHPHVTHSSHGTLGEPPPCRHALAPPRVRRTPRGAAAASEYEPAVCA